MGFIFQKLQNMEGMTDLIVQETDLHNMRNGNTAHKSG